MYIFGVYGGWGVRKTGLDKNLKLGPRQNFGGSGRHTRFKPPEFLSRSPRGADPCKPGWGWTAMRHGARGLFLVTCTDKSNFDFFSEISVGMMATFVFSTSSLGFAAGSLRR